MPSQTSIKAPTRGKADPRMSIVKWARENGAVHIVVDGIEITFPPNMEPMQARLPLDPADIPRLAQSRAKDPESEASGHKGEPMRVSEHPDEYAADADNWMHFKRLTPRGL